MIPKLYSQQAHSQLQNNVREMDKVYGGSGGSHGLLTNIYHTGNLRVSRKTFVVNIKMSKNNAGKLTY